MQIDKNILFAFIVANEQYIIKLLNDEINRSEFRYIIEQSDNISIDDYIDGNYDIKVHLCVSSGSTTLRMDVNQDLIVFSNFMIARQDMLISKYIKRLFVSKNILA